MKVLTPSDLTSLLIEVAQMYTRESSWSISLRPDSVFLVMWEAKLECCTE